MILDIAKSESNRVSSASSCSFELFNYSSYLTGSIEISKLILNNDCSVQINIENDIISMSVPSPPKPETTLSEVTRPCPKEIRKQLNDELTYFFKNPMDKWRTTRAFPWKLFLQFAKLIVVTIHIISIGFEMSSFINKDVAMEATLRSLVFQDWNTNRELNVYPPPQGPYAVYTKANFYGNLNFVIKSLATLRDEGINLFAYDSSQRDQVSPMTLHIHQYSSLKLDPFSFNYDINPRVVHRKIPIKLDLPAGDTGWDNFDLRTYLQSHNETLNFNQMIELKLVTFLRTIFFHSLTSYYYSPACYTVKVEITYDNSAHSGQIKMSLATESFRQKCYGNLSTSETTILNTYTLVTWIVLLVSTISLFLCCRSLKFAWKLYSDVSLVAKKYYRTKLTADEAWLFFDSGLAIIMVNDIVFILASIIKLSNVIKLNEDVTSANRFSLLYGFGILLTWCNLLRYLNLFERFNIVTRTIQRAAVDIFKFTLVALIIFTGYCFSGWIVLGPYHLKFTTLSKASECLFSLLNADDMFATFESLRIAPGINGLIIWWFSRLYIYSFVSLFIYFILNLFITIIIEARDSIQNPRSDIHQRDQQSFLKKFMSEPDE
ncbi:mucolipin-3 [Tetranychus urticae]|uniref:Uncharacterized protein n=1 Tax=Tetranychus urticae TaxID=32264 RepID=T1K8F0_TETUR|nr:mucolipin-3 [Tetranychus urticae]